MEFPVKEVIGALVTMAVTAFGYLQWKRTNRSGSFIRDREAAYKAVWQSLEEIHLYVRGTAFDEHVFDEHMKKANTLLIQHALHIAEADARRAGDYISALRRFGQVLSQALTEATLPARREIQLTGSGVALPPEFRSAYDAYESARNTTMDGFRRALGAGQI